MDVQVCPIENNDDWTGDACTLVALYASKTALLIYLYPLNIHWGFVMRGNFESHSGKLQSLYVHSIASQYQFSLRNYSY
jgi:hypothetical protein